MKVKLVCNNDQEVQIVLEAENYLEQLALRVFKNQVGPDHLSVLATTMRSDEFASFGPNSILIGLKKYEEPATPESV